MAYRTNTSSNSNTPIRRGRKAAAGAHDLNIIFNQAKPFQDLLRFEHDPSDIDPAVSLVQEYARAVRLLYVRTRWSKLGLQEWHSEVNILLSARASTFMGLDIWDPLDDFFDTYLFEMEIQPSGELDAQGRKSVKRGLLRQLQDTASRELETCHKELCDLLEGKLSNWRSLDSRLLAFKKQVWADCEKRGSLCLTPVDGSAVPLATFDMESLSSLNTESMTFTTPSASEYSSAVSTDDKAYYTTPFTTPFTTPYATPYTTPPPSEYASSWTTESVASYTSPSHTYSPMTQPYTC